MSKVRLTISNDRYDMFDSATYIDDAGIETELTCFLNSGFAIDSVVVYKATEYGDIEESYIHYFPHGVNNNKGNIIIVFSMCCDELEVMNDTKEDLIVNATVVKPKEIITKKRGTNLG